MFQAHMVNSGVRHGGHRRIYAMALLGATLSIAGCGAGAAPPTQPPPSAAATAAVLPQVPLTTAPTYTLTDVSVVSVTGTTLPDALVNITDSNGTNVATGTASAVGAFIFALSGIQYGIDAYSVVVTAAGYRVASQGITVTRSMSAAAKARLAAAAAKASAAAAAAAARASAAAAASASAAAAAAVRAYKASAQSMPYNQLVKDPASLAGTVVTYTAQVFQYDTNTGTSNFIASVSNLGYGYWTDNIYADVDPSLTQRVCAKTIVRFWGSVVGPYSYTTTQGGTLTIPEINIMYINVVSNPC